MPMYEYKCPKCRKAHSELANASANLHLKCSGCQTEMQKVFPKTSFILKGEGWAKDCYCKKAS